VHLAQVTLPSLPHWLQRSIRFPRPPQLEQEVVVRRVFPELRMVLDTRPSPPQRVQRVSFLPSPPQRTHFVVPLPLQGVHCLVPWQSAQSGSFAGELVAGTSASAMVLASTTHNAPIKLRRTLFAFMVR
jgi:hypothetical protein